MNKLDVYKEYINTKVNPVVEGMVVDLLLNRPDDVIGFMEKWLQDKKEKFKDLKTTQVPSMAGLKDQQNAYGELSDDDEDDYDESVDELIKRKIDQGPKVRQSVSAEVFGTFNVKKDFVPKVVEKNEETRERIQKKLMEVFLFNNLDQTDIKTVIDAFEEITVAQGEYIIKQGDDGDHLYVVDSGELDCMRQFKQDEGDKHLKTYQPGEAFGELALLYNAPRAASIICKTDCVLFSLDRETFNKIVKDAAIKRREQYNELFNKIELMSTMDAYEKSQVADSLKTTWYEEGDEVIKQGDHGDRFFFIEKGTAKAVKVLQPGEPPKEVFQYELGDYFGELALLRSDTRQASVIATSRLKVCYLDRISFQRLLGPLDEMLKRNMSKYNLYKEEA